MDSSSHIFFLIETFLMIMKGEIHLFFLVQKFGSSRIFLALAIFLFENYYLIIYLEFYQMDRQKITSDSLSVKMENLLLIEIPPGD